MGGTPMAGCSPAGGALAHLVLVDNPAQHPLGDFQLDEQGLVRERKPAESGFTYDSSIFPISHDACISSVSQSKAKGI